MHPEKKSKLSFRIRYSALFLLSTLFILLSLSHAWAHNVMIFAWVEGDTVYTQSKVGGKKVKNSTVVVYDMEGNQLLEGKTDDRGEFSFNIPQKTALKVVFKASMGHMAEWTIPTSEITGSEENIEGSPVLLDDKSGTDESYLSKTATYPSKTIETLDYQELRKIIDDSLDKKIAPIRDMLTDSIDCGPRMSEVIGGIGYIFGLVGISLYFISRRKKE